MITEDFIDAAARLTKKAAIQRKERLHGIDPDSEVAREIFRLSKEVSDLRSAIKTQNDRIAELVKMLKKAAIAFGNSSPWDN